MLPFEPQTDCAVHCQVSACFVQSVRDMADTIARKRLELKSNPAVFDVEGALADERKGLWQTIVDGPAEPACRMACKLFARPDPTPESLTA